MQFTTNIKFTTKWKQLFQRAKIQDFRCNSQRETIILALQNETVWLNLTRWRNCFNVTNRPFRGTSKTYLNVENLTKVQLLRFLQQFKMKVAGMWKDRLLSTISIWLSVWAIGWIDKLTKQPGWMWNMPGLYQRYIRVLFLAGFHRLRFPAQRRKSTEDSWIGCMEPNFGLKELFGQKSHINDGGFATRHFVAFNVLTF